MKGPELKGASILVTGSTGLLGQELVRSLSGVNRVRRVSRSGLDHSLVCDLSQSERVSGLLAEAPDLVIHAAAFSDVDGCEKDPRQAHESNAVSTRNLADVCGQKRIPLIYVSTDYVFDGQKRTPYLEEDPTAPVNIYGLTKLEGEFYVRRQASISAVVRTSWLFGEGAPSNFVNSISKRLKTDKLVRVLGDQRDAPTYAVDLAEALERIGARLVENARNGRFSQDIFQVCNGGGATRYEMALKIKEFLGASARVERMEKGEIPNRLAIRPAYAVMSTRHYERAFGVTVRPWEESLGDYLARSAN